MGPESEPEGRAEPQPTAEPEPGPESEPEHSTGMPSGGGVTLTEMMVPPFALIILLLLGIVILIITKCLKRTCTAKISQVRRKSFDKVDVILLGSMTESHCGEQLDQHDQFLTLEEMESMEALKRHYNRPLSLFLITLPAIISLAICPCLLLLRGPLIAAFWPNGLPNINDGVGCFLAPAGLVYAVTFGFTFQSVLDKQRGITTTVSTEVGLLDQILAMTSRMTSLTTQDRLKIYRLVKTEIISIMQQVTGHRGMSSKDYRHEYSAGQIWDVVNILQKGDKGRDHCDTTIVEKIISNLQDLATCSTARYMTLHYTVHPLLWMFLEVLGFFSYFGVMLIVTESDQMDLMMCLITVFSISLLCYVIGDLDHPFSGYFRVNMSTLWHLVGKTEHFYREEQGKESDSIQTPSTRSLSYAAPTKQLSPTTPSVRSRQTL